jgi:hypothetical protein
MEWFFKTLCQCQKFPYQKNASVKKNSSDAICVFYHDISILSIPLTYTTRITGECFDSIQLVLTVIFFVLIFFEQ